MNREILRLAIPNIISNVTIPLLGLVDLALMGHLDSEIYIGAVALGTVIFNFIYWGFSFLRMSTSGFTAQSYGEGNLGEAFNILGRALLISTLLSFLILVFQIPIEWLSFVAINGSHDVETLAKEYFGIRIWAAPATLGLYAINGWFLGMQNARYVMITAILSNIFNLIFSYIFVYVFNLNSAGVAWGTVLAQYTGIIVCLYLLRQKYGKAIGAWKLNTILDLQAMKKFFQVNSDIFIRTFCVILVFTFFTSKSASANDSILAVNSMLLQFLLLFSFFIDGFAFAGEALVGKYIGRNDVVSLRKTIRLLFYWGGGLALLYTLVYFVANDLIMRILTNNISLIEQSQRYLIWVVLIPLISFASFIWDGIYIGATASKAMRNTMIAATILIFAPSYYFCHSLFGNHALWLAMSLFLFSRGLFQTIISHKSILQKVSR